LTATESPASSRGATLATLVVAVFVLGLSVAALRSYRDLSMQRDRERQLTERVQETRERVEVEERRLRRLADDPQMLERLAREELGMVRPDEVVFVFPGEQRIRSPAPAEEASVAPVPLAR
jgi:cell division protein FtsB